MDLFINLFVSGLCGLLAWWLLSDDDWVGEGPEGDDPEWVGELESHERDRAA